jgi:hypothetical protein
MTREPKIPMSPTELPQQRIHEVVGLPDRPEPFDFYVDYNAGSLPKNTDTNSTYLCQVEWAWPPMQNRLGNTSKQFISDLVMSKSVRCELTSFAISKTIRT